MSLYFLIRRIILACTIVFCDNHTYVQLFLQIGFSIFITDFFSRVRPLEEPILNYMEIYNELTILICSYLMLCFSELVENANQRIEIGWTYIMIVSLNILINWAVLIFKTLRQLWTIVKSKIDQYKKKQIKQKIDIQE